MPTMSGAVSGAETSADRPSKMPRMPPRIRPNRFAHVSASCRDLLRGRRRSCTADCIGSIQAGRCYRRRVASLSDAALRHLQHVVDHPDLSGTRYTLIDALGRGGMGAVYRVLDEALSREVAMKVLTGAVDDGARARLENEARVLARLEHPGIVPVHDVGTLPDGRVFYVMKLVRGGALRTPGASVPAVPERLRLIVRIADAIAFAHAHGIVHRDLTPANVMIGPFGEVLVMDWGIALVSHGERLIPPDPSSALPASWLRSRPTATPTSEATSTRSAG